MSSVDRTAQVSASTVSGIPSSPASRADGAIALVTPIGADGLGVTTAAAVDGRAGEIEAMLPSGKLTSARLLGTSNGVAVVQLPDATATDATQLAETTEGGWTVVAFGDEFDISGEGDALRSLAVPEAAPIFDASGALVGLCTIGPDGVELLAVTSLPDLSPTIASSEPANNRSDGCFDRADREQRHDERRRERADIARQGPEHGSRVDPGKHGRAVE